MITIIIVFLSGCSWSKKHQTMFGFYSVVTIIDIIQTREILSNDQYYERNPIMTNMTPNQAALTMVGGYGVVYMLADNYPKYRTWIIGIPLTVGMICVYNNFKIGVHF